jgi:hypothetical protein
MLITTTTTTTTMNARIDEDLAEAVHVRALHHSGGRTLLLDVVVDRGHPPSHLITASENGKGRKKERDGYGT